MLPVLLLAATLSAAEGREPSASLSFGTGMRFGMLGLRGALLLEEGLWLSGAVGLPLQVYGEAFDSGFRADVTPAIEYVETSWPPIAVAMTFGIPVGEAISVNTALTTMFVRGHRNDFHGPFVPSVYQTSLAFSLVLGAQIALVGPVFLDIGAGPSFNICDFNWAEDEFNRKKYVFGLDWALGLGFLFL